MSDRIKDLIEKNRQTNNVLTNELLRSFDSDKEYVKDGDFYCKRCHSKRTCFGLTGKVRCACLCDKAKEEEQARIEHRKNLLERTRGLEIAALGGKRYAEACFATTDVTSRNFNEIAKRCNHYCKIADEVLKRGTGIYLFGASGIGKTHLTVCMDKELKSRYYSSLITSVGKLAIILKDNYANKKSERAFLDKIARVDFLFLDDFGVEQMTRGSEDLWIQEKVFNIINERYNDLKPIIYTSNYSLKELGTERGFSKKTLDRIAETTVKIHLESLNYRAKLLESQKELF